MDPGHRRARDPHRPARRGPGVLRQLPHAARAVVAAARQRVPADPGGRHDLRHPDRRHRPLGRRRARLHGDHGRPHAERGDAGRRRHPGHAARRRPDRAPDRRADPVLRRAAVHRVAGRDVRRPRPGVPGEPVVDQDRGPGDPVAADQAVPHRGVVPRADRDHRARGRGRRCARAAFHPIRAHHLRDRRQRAVGPPDGPAGRPHQAARLRDQRHLRRTRRASSSAPTRAPDTRSTASEPSSTRSRPL